MLAKPHATLASLCRHVSTFGGKSQCARRSTQLVSNIIYSDLSRFNCQMSDHVANPCWRQLGNARNFTTSQPNGNSTSKREARHVAIGTFGFKTPITPEDSKFVVNNSSGEDKIGSNEPIVFIFGWAGAKQKNLHKYGDVYRKQGCSTVEFILPTRFIFRHTEQVSEVMTEVYKQLGDKYGWQYEEGRDKIIVHSLSDTGVMTFQGFCLAVEDHPELENPPNFRPNGIVWDSCPGPRPRVTLPRTLVLTGINWFSRIRDGMSLSKAITSSYYDFRDLCWRNFIRRAKGLETKISVMEGIWCGFWARDLNWINAKTGKPPAELFFYSTADFYLPSKYLEAHVLPVRQKICAQNGGNLTVCKFAKSPHVAHLPRYKERYTQQIADFLKIAF